MNDLKNKDNIENQEENLEKIIENPHIVNNLNDNKEKKVDKKTLNDNNIFEYEQIISQKNKKNNIIDNFELTKNIGFKNIGHTCYMNSFFKFSFILQLFYQN